jgi:hypothetical protein
VNDLNASIDRLLGDIGQIDFDVGCGPRSHRMHWSPGSLRTLSDLEEEVVLQALAGQECLCQSIIRIWTTNALDPLALLNSNFLPDRVARRKDAVSSRAYVSRLPEPTRSSRLSHLDVERCVLALQATEPEIRHLLALDLLRRTKPDGSIRLKRWLLDSLTHWSWSRQ